MEVRKATRDDWPAIGKLHSVAFASSRTEFAATDDDAVDIAHTWGVFEAGSPVSVLMSHEFAAMHDGAFVPTAGIGGVATLPEHRRRGHVRRLFEVAFAEMRDRGQLFTTLFPFSYPYYRMFGYELVYSRNTYTVPLDAIDSSIAVGRIERVVVGDPEVRGIYERFVASRNLSLQRSERWWQQHARVEPYRDQVFTYLYRDGDGCPRGYVTCHMGRDRTGDTVVTVRDVACETDDVLATLLSRLGVLYPHASRVSLHLPTDLPLDLVIPVPDRMEHRRSAVMMGRIVDVRGVLAATRWNGSGELVIGVADDGIPANDGAFRIEWDGGGCRVESSALPPDVRTDVRTLTQMICGYLDGGTASRLGRVESARAPAELASILPAKPLYQNDPF